MSMWIQKLLKQDFLPDGKQLTGCCPVRATGGTETSFEFETNNLTN